MKKCLLGLMFIVSIAFPKVSCAQFSVTSDTVYATVNGSASIFDDIINHTSSTLTLKWHVIYSNFPADWLTAGALGLCDNTTCYSNGSDGSGHPMQLWNNVTHSGDFFTSAPYGDTTTHGSYDMALNLASADTIGTFLLTVNFTQIGGTGASATETFVITRPVPSGVGNYNPSENNISLYPNPARDEVNIVYDESADIKSIAVYNIIGKVMSVYRPTSNTSANLSIENIPSGIYFVRLVNSHGQVVVTKKFTKQ